MAKSGYRRIRAQPLMTQLLQSVHSRLVKEKGYNQAGFNAHHFLPVTLSLSPVGLPHTNR